MAKRVAERELTDRNWDQEDEVEEAGTFSVASKAELQKRQIKTAKRSRGSMGGSSGSSAFAGFGGFAFKPTQTSTPFNMNVKSFTNGKTDKSAEDNVMKLNGIPEKPEEKKDDNEKEDNSKYMSNLRSLNESVLAWIKQHVEKNPYCILTPIFTDYEKHLKNIENDKSNSSIAKSPVKDNCDKSSAPANKDSQPSLSALFKPAAGTWTCDTCMIQNKPDVNKCVACQTSKPGGGASSSQTSSEAPANKDSQPSLSSLFKPAAGTWTCDTCMIQNKPDVNKCVACQTSKPGEGTSPPKTNSTGASDFKFGSNSGSSGTSVSGFKFGTGTSESSSTKTGIKFGTSESNATTGGFKFESSGTANSTTSSGFTFGKGDTKSTTSGFSFGKVEEKSTSGFTFGKTGTTEASPASGFQFGSGNGSSSVSSGFTFGTNSGTNNAPKSGFSFGSGNSSTTTEAAKGFSFTPSTTTASSTFGAGFFSKPATSADATGASTTQEDEEYEPPKVESTEVAEEGSLYSVKCKLFYQRDGKWNEKGVGFLHLKKADDKAQLVVRADTNLGNILLNIMLSPSIPLKRQGTNNVYLFCVPNPKINPKDEDNKPVAMLVRVKNSEAADQLLEKMEEVRKE